MGKITDYDVLSQLTHHMREIELKKYRPAVIFLTCLLPLIAIIGIAGNSLVVYVFQKHAYKRTSNFFILILGCCDLCICVFSIPLTLAFEVWRVRSVSFFCKCIAALQETSVTTSALILVLIALDRFLIVCFVPSIQMNRRIANVLVLTIVVFCAILAIPSVLYTGTYMRIDKTMTLDAQTLVNNTEYIREEGHASYNQCHNDERNIPFYYYKRLKTATLVVYLVMLVSITVFYSLIFFFIFWRHRKFTLRYRSSSMRGKRTEITRLDEADSLGPQNRSFTTTVETIELFQTQTRQNSVDDRADEVTAQINKPNSPSKRDQLENSNNSEASKIEECQSSPENVKLIIKRTPAKDSTILFRRNKHVRSTRTAQTLALVSFLFVVSYAPYLLINNDILMVFNAKARSHVWYGLRKILFFSFYLNSVMNPFVYAFINPIFKGELRQIRTRINCYK